MMTEQQYRAEFNRLRDIYEQSGSVDDLAALILMSDQYIYGLKLDPHLWHEAFDVLMELEQVVELPPLQQYRKAVLLCTTKQDRRVAYDLFMALIRDDTVEESIRDRSCGYMMCYLTDIVKISQQQALLNQLRGSRDDRARQMLEQAFASARYEDIDGADDEPLRPEDIIAYRNMDTRQYGTISTKKQQMLIYDEHRPEDYVLYLDWVQERWLAGGQPISLHDARVLFTMIEAGQACTAEQVYNARYRSSDVDGVPVFKTGDKAVDKRTRAKLDQYYKGLKERLRACGITTEGHSLATSTSYFIIYPELNADELTAVR